MPAHIERDIRSHQTPRGLAKAELPRAVASDLVVRRLLCATAASTAARYAEQQRRGGQRAPRTELAAQLRGRAAAARLQLGPALEAGLEAVAAVQVAQHLGVKASCKL